MRIRATRGPTYRVARFVLRIPALRVTPDHAYVITFRHIRGTTLFLIREESFAFFHFTVRTENIVFVLHIRVVY